MAHLFFSVVKQPDELYFHTIKCLLLLVPEILYREDLVTISILYTWGLAWCDPYSKFKLRQHYTDDHKLNFWLHPWSKHRLSEISSSYIKWISSVFIWIILDQSDPLLLYSTLIELMLIVLKPALIRLSIHSIKIIFLNFLDDVIHYSKGLSWFCLSRSYQFPVSSHDLLSSSV